MEELKLIERQLEVVIDGCMSEEEKKRRAKDKFGQKRKEVINMLDQTRAVCYFYIFFIQFFNYFLTLRIY